MSILVAAISPSTLTQRLNRVDQIWPDARAVSRLALRPNIATLRAVLDNQTAAMPSVNDRRRKPTFDIAWIEACAGAAQLKTNVWVRGVQCDFTGWVAGTNKQTISIKTRISDAFATPVEMFDNLFTPEELYAEAFARMEKGLAEMLENHVLASLNTWAGTNNYRKGLGLGTGAVTSVAGTPAAANEAWKRTSIPYKNLYPTAFNAYVKMLQRVNRLQDLVVIEGGILELSENVDGSLEQYKFGTQRVYSDVENFGGQGLENDILLLARGAVAIPTVTNFTTTPTVSQGSNYYEIQVSRPLLGLRDTNGNPVMMDIITKRTKRAIAQEDFPGLAIDNRCEEVDLTYGEINFQVVLNPLACNESITGVIRLVADPARPYIQSPGIPVQNVNV